MRSLYFMAQTESVFSLVSTISGKSTLHILPSYARANSHRAGVLNAKAGFEFAMLRCSCFEREPVKIVEKTVLIMTMYN